MMKDINYRGNEWNLHGITIIVRRKIFISQKILGRFLVIFLKPNSKLIDYDQIEYQIFVILPKKSEISNPKSTQAHERLSQMSPLQLTLSILKPHVVKNPFAIEKIIQIIQENDLEIVRRATVQMTQSLAAKFYAEHRGKFFYNRLETSMCRQEHITYQFKAKPLRICLLLFIHSGPIDIMVLGGNNAITKWRTLLGPTKTFKTVYTHPNSIRGLFGLSDTRNAGHGSDSMDSAKQEISIFFNDFDVDRWINQHPSNHLNAEKR